MAIVSISKAAELASVARSTIHRHVKKGKLSKVRQPDGSPGIDTSELIRHFGELGQKQDATVQDVAPDTAGNIQSLQREIELLQGQVAILTDVVANATKREQQLFKLLETKLLVGPGGKKKKGGKKGK